MVGPLLLSGPKGGERHLSAVSLVSALIQAAVGPDPADNVAKHVEAIKQAAFQGARIICLQELFNTQYFAARSISQPGPEPPPWAEPVPAGPTTRLMQDLARELGVVLMVPLAEAVPGGAHFNTAVVIDADGSISGKYRKMHVPHMEGFWERTYFQPGDLGYPVFRTAFATIGVLIDFDRHYPEVPRLLALQGAEVLYNPCTTVMDLSHYAWFIEQRSHAVANAVFVGTVNRVGQEPYSSGTYYGTSYFCDPSGEIIAQGSQDQDDIVVATLDLERIGEERRRWDFLRNRRGETYGLLAGSTTKKGEQKT